MQLVFCVRFFFYFFSWSARHSVLEQSANFKFSGKFSLHSTREMGTVSMSSTRPCVHTLSSSSSLSAVAVKTLLLITQESLKLMLHDYNSSASWNVYVYIFFSLRTTRRFICCCGCELCECYGEKCLHRVSGEFYSIYLQLCGTN